MDTAAIGHSTPEADNALTRLFTAYQHPAPRNEITGPSSATSISIPTSWARHHGTARLSSTPRCCSTAQTSAHLGGCRAVDLPDQRAVLGCAIFYGGEKPAVHSAMVANLGVRSPSSSSSWWNCRTPSSANWGLPPSRCQVMSGGESSSGVHLLGWPEVNDIQRLRLMTPRAGKPIMFRRASQQERDNLTAAASASGGLHERSPHRGVNE